MAKKYLDKAGLNYLWQKIKLNFKLERDYSDSEYIHQPSNWLDQYANTHRVAEFGATGNQVFVGKRLERDVFDHSVFVDEGKYYAADQQIPVQGVTGGTGFVIPFAAHNVNGVVYTTDTSSTPADVRYEDDWRAVPIVGGVPYYKAHHTYGTTGTTGEIKPDHGATFAVIDGLEFQNGHVVGTHTSIVQIPITGVDADTDTIDNQIMLGSSSGDKNIKNSGYTIGGDILPQGVTGCTGKLATETAVRNALDSHAVQGVTGKILKIENQLIDTDLYISIDQGGATSGSSDRAWIRLWGHGGKQGGQLVAEVDASQFVIDGMLEKVEYDRTTHSLIFTWNTDSGIQTTTVDLDDIIAPYVAGNGIEITVGATGASSVDVNVINVKPDNDTAQTAGYHKVDLYAGPSGLRAEVDVRDLVDRNATGQTGNVMMFGASGAILDSGVAADNIALRSGVIGTTGPVNLAEFGQKVPIGTVDGKEFYFTMPADDEPLNKEDCDGAFDDAETYLRETGATAPAWPTYPGPTYS